MQKPFAPEAACVLPASVGAKVRLREQSSDPSSLSETPMKAQPSIPVCVLQCSVQGPDGIRDVHAIVQAPHRTGKHEWACRVVMSFPRPIDCLIFGVDAAQACDLALRYVHGNLGTHLLGRYSLAEQTPVAQASPGEDPKKTRRRPAQSRVRKQ